MPSTLSATITIVANTGWLMATRVIHMASPRDFWVGLFQRARAAFGFEARRLAVLQVVELRRDDVLRRLHAGEDLDIAGALVAHADGHRATLEAVGDEHPDMRLRAFAAHRRYRQRGGVALGGDGEAHAREHARLEERAFVLERHVDVDRARARLGARVDALDATLEHAIRQAFDRHLGRHLGLDLGDVAERGLRLHLELRQVDDAEQHGVEADLLAGLHVAL